MSPFPLPLTPFEHYMLVDDRPAYPMSPWFRLQFSGRFDQDRLTAALATAIELNPLLNARVRGDVAGRTSGLDWVAADAPPPRISWEPESAPIDFPKGVHIDLNAEPGVRLWVREGPKSTRLLLQVHHACSDGLGVLQFLETWLTLYRDANSPDAIAALRRNFESGALAQRDQSKLGLAQQVLRVYKDIIRVARFYRHRPTPLAAGHRQAPPTPTDYLGFQSHGFSEIETDQIRIVSKQAGVCLNSLLLKAVFLALDQWNREQPPGGRPIRIALPVTVRDSSPRMKPAFNGVSMAFIDREPAQLGDLPNLLAGIENEIEEAKKLRRALALPPILRLLGKFRRGLASQLGAERCLASAIFSNVGTLFAGSPLLDKNHRLVVGAHVLEDFEGAPPLRPETRAGFAAFCYANRLKLTLNCDPHTMTAADCARILLLCVEQVHALRAAPRTATLPEPGEHCVAT